MQAARHITHGFEGSDHIVYQRIEDLYTCSYKYGYLVSDSDSRIPRAG